MARRTNYGFEKRQRELKKQKKKEAKAEKKRLKKEAAEQTLSEEGSVATEEGQEIEPGSEDELTAG